MSPTASQAPVPTPTPTPMPFALTATDFPSGGAIPSRFTCQGEDISPGLSWNVPPAGTQSFAIIMDDPDTPVRAWDNWVVFNIPPELRALAENRPSTTQLPNGATQGRNSWGGTGYGGPCPLAGPAHTYRFILYAVDRLLILPEGAIKGQLQAALRGHVLAEGLLTGSYQKTGRDEDDGDDNGADDGGGEEGGAVD
jgi:Raf kinase inhibitor-like YbhB/YbcL family protein